MIKKHANKTVTIPQDKNYVYEFDKTFGFWSLKPKELTGKYKEIWDNLLVIFIEKYDGDGFIKDHVISIQKSRIYIGLIKTINKTTNKVINDSGLIGDKRNIAILNDIGNQIKQLISHHKGQLYRYRRKTRLTNLFRNESNDHLFKIIERIRVDGDYRHRFSITRYATQYINEADIPLLNSIISDRRNGKISEILD